MPALRYDFDLEQGATFNRSFQWLKSNGTPYTMTNWRARMLVKEGYGMSILFDLSTENGGISLIGGNITILITDTQSNSIKIPVINPNTPPKKNLFYNIFLFPPNKVIKYMSGVISVIGAL